MAAWSYGFPASFFGFVSPCKKKRALHPKDKTHQFISSSFWGSFFQMLCHLLDSFWEH